MKSVLRRFLIVFAMLGAFSLPGVMPAQAVLHGVPDEGEHPYVGLVTDFEFVCSGSLISPTVFITAAHCFDAPGQEVSVTVDEDAFASSSTFVSGHWYPDPEFCLACAGGTVGFDTHDVAVVILDSPLTVSRYASLPSLGLVDSLPMKQPVDVVGYGLQVREKVYTDEAFTRYQAPAQLVQSRDRIAAEFLKVSANPAKGKGGTCFGDSGGPILYGDTILGVNSFVTNGNCAGVTYSYRIDTADALSFINATIAAH
jgi:secreted trypsin-like serine protease